VKDRGCISERDFYEVMILPHTSTIIILKHGTGIESTVHLPLAK